MSEVEIRAMLDDTQTLMLTLIGEARGEEVEGRIAVANVIRNRMRDDRWPDTVKDVCLQKMQFSCWQPLGGAVNYKGLLALAESCVLNASLKAVKTNGFVALAILEETDWIARGIISGVARDRTGGANHYLTRALWESAPPAWARGQSPTCLIQRHAFFKL